MGSQDLAKKWCKISVFIIGLIVCIVLSPVLVIYEKGLHFGIECFIDIPGAQAVLTYFYLVIVAIYVLLPFTVLPALNGQLFVTIRRWRQENQKLTRDSIKSIKTSQRPKRHEVKVGVICALISIYTSICLSPNILWFFLLFSVFSVLINQLIKNLVL